MFVVSTLLSTLPGKIVAGVVASSLAAGTGVLVVKTANVLSDPPSASRGAAAEYSTTASAKSKSANQTPAKAGAEAASSAAGQGAEASARSGLSAPGLSGNAGANVQPGVAVLKPNLPGGQYGGGGWTGPGTGGGSGDSNPVTTPQVPNPSTDHEVPEYGTPIPAAPSTTLPSGVEVYRSGSHSVVVPATQGDGQQICLKGTLVNKCRTVTVPPTKAVTLTFSYDGNASASAPTFTVNPCERGVEIGVAGLTPGSTVEAQAEGTTLSAEISSQEAGQAASFCKA